MAVRTRPQPTRATINGPVPGQTDKTVGDYIIEQITAGVDPPNACGVAGVLPAEFTAWMREGAMAVARLNAGADWHKDLTREQQDLTWFAIEVVRARSSHIARLTVQAERMAHGGVEKRRTVTRTDASGAVLERTTTVETTLPDTDMLRWKLERLEPTVYGQKATLNLNVQDLTDTDATKDLLAERMAEVSRGLHDMFPDAIEATTTDPEPQEPTS